MKEETFIFCGEETEKYYINPITKEKQLSTAFIVCDYERLQQEKKELIEWLEEEIINLKSFVNTHVSEFEKNIKTATYEEILSDLEQLKEKIMYNDDMLVDNDNHPYVNADKILGIKE